MMAPRVYALDEHGAHIEAWLGTYREGSAFAAWPGVPAVLDVTESTQIGGRLVLLDVDTLQVRRVDRLELDGKWQCNYRPAELREHLEAKIADCRRFRLRYDSKAMARALRRLAAAGAPSSWRLSPPRPHPEHPAVDHDFMIARGRPGSRSCTRRRRRCATSSACSAAPTCICSCSRLSWSTISAPGHSTSSSQPSTACATWSPSAWREACGHDGGATGA